MTHIIITANFRNIKTIKSSIEKYCQISALSIRSNCIPSCGAAALLQMRVCVGLPFLFSRGKVPIKYFPRENFGKWTEKIYKPIEYKKRHKLCLRNFSIWLVIYEIKNTICFTNSIEIHTFFVLKAMDQPYHVTKFL